MEIEPSGKIINVENMEETGKSREMRKRKWKKERNVVQ